MGAGDSERLARRGLCRAPPLHRPGVADALASLIVAASDLNVVRLIRGAIRAADCASGVVGPLGIIRCDRFERRFHIHPTPGFEPRPVYHPTPRFEPRPVVHPAPRFVDRPAPSPAPVEAEQPSRTKSPLDPPWKMHPWEIPVQPAPKIKVNILRPDIINKGSLIDFYL